MRKLLFVLMLFSVACTPPVEPHKRVVGDTLDKGYFRDLYTGKCVSIDGLGKFNDITIEPESMCGAKQ